jgi:hypothetical protein
MNMILKLGACALVAGTAIAVAGSAISGASSHTAGAALAREGPAHSAAPISHLSQLSEDKMPRIKVEEARKLVAEDSAVIIDVRNLDSYKISHIKGALHFPMDKLEAGDLKDLPKDKRIIAYCA